MVVLLCDINNVVGMSTLKCPTTIAPWWTSMVHPSSNDETAARTLHDSPRYACALPAHLENELRGILRPRSKVCFRFCTASAMRVHTMGSWDARAATPACQWGAATWRAAST
jgi:hypothetical protein